MSFERKNTSLQMLCGTGYTLVADAVENKNILCFINKILCNTKFGQKRNSWVHVSHHNYKHLKRQLRQYFLKSFKRRRHRHRSLMHHIENMPYCNCIALPMVRRPHLATFTFFLVFFVVSISSLVGLHSLAKG